MSKDISEKGQKRDDRCVADVDLIGVLEQSFLTTLMGETGIAAYHHGPSSSSKTADVSMQWCPELWIQRCPPQGILHRQHHVLD
jgi:hypothetical protein